MDPEPWTLQKRRELSNFSRQKGRIEQGDKGQRDDEGAEDQDFFRRKLEMGYTFIWCHEAIVSETIPLVKCTRSFVLRRALLRGIVSTNHPSFGAKEVLRSLVAIFIYLCLANIIKI